MIKTLTIITLIILTYQVQGDDGLIQIATDPTSPPFTFLEEGSTNPTGLDIDLLAAVTAVANLDYEIVQLPWTTLFEQVRDSQVDLAVSGITINDVRKETYDFSVPYYLSIHKILAKEGTDIKSAQDLINKRVAVKNGTTGAAAVERIFGGDNPNILRYPNQDEGIQAVIDGQADAYVNDNGHLEYYAKNNPGWTVIADPNAFQKEFYGYMFPKGSDLVGAFNEGITAILESGEYAGIYRDWLGADPDVDLLLAAGRDQDPYDELNESHEEGVNEGEEENAETEVEWVEM